MTNSAALIARLTPRQQEFVHAFVKGGGVIAEAARALGIGIQSARTYRRRPEVAEAIDAVYLEANERIDLAGKIATTKEWLLDTLRAEYDADLADLFDAGTGELKPIHQWPLIWRKGLVLGVDITTDVVGSGENAMEYITKKLKTSERFKRLEAIGRHVDVNAFKDVVEHKGIVDIGTAFEQRKAAARAGLEGEESND